MRAESAAAVADLPLGRLERDGSLMTSSVNTLTSRTRAQKLPPSDERTQPHTRRVPKSSQMQDFLTAAA